MCLSPTDTTRIDLMEQAFRRDFSRKFVNGSPRKGIPSARRFYDKYHRFISYKTQEILVDVDHTNIHILVKMCSKCLR